MALLRSSPNVAPRGVGAAAPMQVMALPPGPSLQWLAGLWLRSCLGLSQQGCGPCAALHELLASPQPARVSVPPCQSPGNLLNRELEQAQNELELARSKLQRVQRELEGARTELGTLLLLALRDELRTGTQAQADLPHLLQRRRIPSARPIVGSLPTSKLSWKQQVGGPSEAESLSWLLQGCTPTSRASEGSGWARDWLSQGLGRARSTTAVAGRSPRPPCPGTLPPLAMPAGCQPYTDIHGPAWAKLRGPWGRWWHWGFTPSLSLSLRVLSSCAAGAVMVLCCAVRPPGRVPGWRAVPLLWPRHAVRGGVGSFHSSPCLTPVLVPGSMAEGCRREA